MLHRDLILPDPDLEGCAAGTVDQKVDTGVEDHEQPGHGVDFIKEEAWDVLHLPLDATDDEGGGEYLVCSGSDPEIEVMPARFICGVLFVVSQRETRRQRVAYPQEEIGNTVHTYMHESNNSEQACQTASNRLRAICRETRMCFGSAPTVVS